MSLTITSAVLTITVEYVAPAAKPQQTPAMGANNATFAGLGWPALSVELWSPMWPNSTPFGKTTFTFDLQSSLNADIHFTGDEWFMIFDMFQGVINPDQIGQLLVYDAYIVATRSDGSVGTLYPQEASVVGNLSSPFDGDPPYGDNEDPYNHVEDPLNAIDGSLGTFANVYRDPTVASGFALLDCPNLKIKKFVGPYLPGPGLEDWLLINEQPSGSPATGGGITNRSHYLYLGEGANHTFNLQMRQRGTANFTMRALASDSYEPVIGQQIWLYDQNALGFSLAFTGLIQDYTNRWTGIDGFRYIDVTAVSLESVFDTVYATPVQYQGETCGAIVKDLLSRFESGCPVGRGIISDGPVIALLNTNYEKISDLFTQLATTAGFTWGVDPQTQLLYFCLPSTVAAPFTLTSERALWDTITNKLDGADYRNRQAVRLSFDAFEHSKEFFVGSGQTSITLLRPVNQVVKAWATLSTCNTATGTFSGIPAPGDTVLIGPAPGAWQALHVYGIGGTITVNGFVQKVTSAGTSGASQPTFSTITGNPTTDGSVIWTCQGLSGLSTGTDTYTFVAALDNTQFGEVLIGASASECCQHLFDAINAKVSARGITFSLPTWECSQCNAISKVGDHFTLQQKSAGTGWVATISATGTAFSWSADQTSRGTSPQGSLGPGEGATIELQVYATGTSVAAPAVIYTQGSAVITLASPLNAGSNLNVEYTRADGNIIEVEDTALVNAYQIVTGGTGKVQQITDASSQGLISVSSAAGLQLAQQALSAYDVVPTKLEVQLYRPGLVPGQEFTFALTGALSVLNGTYFIEEVSAELVPTWPYLDSPSALHGGHYRYTLRLIDIAQIGSYLDFWEGLGGGGGGGGTGGGGALVSSAGGGTPTNPGASSASYPLGVLAKTASYTAASTDAGRLIVVEDTSPHTAVTITLPPVPPSLVWQIEIQNASSYAVTIARNGLLIDTLAANLTLPAGSGLEIRTDGTNYFTQRGVAGTLAKYTTSWSAQTSVTVTHNLGTTAVIVQVFDAGGVLMDPETVTVTSSAVVTLGFGAAFTGSVVVIG